MGSLTPEPAATTFVTAVPAATADSIARGWRLAGGFLMTLALGTLYAWSVFVAPLEAEFGWKRAQTSAVFTIAVLMFSSSFIIAGRLQDKFGPFWVAFTGSILVSAGFFLCAYTSSLPHLLFCYGVLGGIGNSFGYSTIVPVMAKWFPDKRGLAIGLALTGYGGGSAIFGPIASLWMIPRYGWRSTFMILGLILLAMTMTGTLLVRNPPEGYRPAGWTPGRTQRWEQTTYEFRPSEVLRTPTFYLMWCGFGFGSTAGLMVISQLLPFARSQGVPGAALVTMGLVVGAFGNVSGRLLSGWLSDMLGRLNTLRIVLVIATASMPMLYKVGANVAALYVMVWVVYFCYGAQGAVNPTAVADFFGTRNAGINYSLLFTSWGVAGTIGPTIGGVLFDRYHNYEAAFYAAAAFAAIALICVLAAKRPEAPMLASSS
jgi:OFA family oxalate/formate antiporter-like MFS transporter